MNPTSSSLEFYRWGLAGIPGIIFHYAKELDLEVEDIGLLCAMFYTMERTRPLFQTGVSVGQILMFCPFITKQKLSGKLTRLAKLEIIAIEETGKSFTDKKVYFEPLMQRLDELLRRDHPGFSSSTADNDNDGNMLVLLNQYRNRIEQLELQVEEEKRERVIPDLSLYPNGSFKKVADFIAKKTGNLLSVKMAAELKKWLEDMSFNPEFLLIMLELCFERKIYNPREITQIANQIRENSINTVEDLELFLNNYVDNDKINPARLNRFDPDIQEFGSYTGIDMAAAARKKMYYKWRYDWGFTHVMIMKAGEIMCQRTKNGGLEYIDSVLHNWLSKEIRQVEDAEKEIREFKNRSRKDQTGSTNGRTQTRSGSTEYEIYVPPSLEEIKSKV
ncbi:MAG: DnaD domain protein [Deltaproteobacteria bacterium]